MNIKTGEVLAMANLPDFDPNDAYKLTSEKYINELKKNVAKILKEENVKVEIPDAWYTEGGLDNLPEAIHDNSDLVDALGSARVNILMKTWRNPVIADNYEPGSTFKLMTVSTAYDLGATHAEDTYYCGGSPAGGELGDQVCKHKRPRHADADRSPDEFLQRSDDADCPAHRHGSVFYNFLQGVRPDSSRPASTCRVRARGQFHKLDVASDWNEVALATASFGQRFHGNADSNAEHGQRDRGRRQAEKKAVCCQGRAGCGDGSVKSTNETEVVRQVISEDTSAYMREAMEQVVANGTGKNAYVPGYRRRRQDCDLLEIQPE